MFIITFFNKMTLVEFRPIVFIYIVHYIPMLFFFFITFDNNVLLIPKNIMNGPFMIDEIEHTLNFCVMI